MTNAGRVTVYRHVQPEMYLAIPFSKTASIVLKWFREYFLDGQDYQAVEELAKTGAAGLWGVDDVP